MAPATLTMLSLRWNQTKFAFDWPISFVDFSEILAFSSVSCRLASDLCVRCGQGRGGVGWGDDEAKDVCLV